MAKYECLCCGLRFSRPKRFDEARSACFGFPAAERLAGCPHCGGAYMEYTVRDQERRPEDD